MEENELEILLSKKEDLYSSRGLKAPLSPISGEIKVEDFFQGAISEIDDDETLLQEDLKNKENNTENITENITENNNQNNENSYLKYGLIAAGCLVGTIVAGPTGFLSF
jgi:dynactin complex subunit